MSEFVKNFHFQVDWGGTRIGFESVSNLVIGREIIEVREGSSPEFMPRKLPGMQYVGNILLQRGVVRGDNEFFDWWNSIQLDTLEARNITIALLNSAHEPVVVWKIRNAIPVEVVWGDLDATASEIAVESLEIACDGISVQND